MQSLVGSLQSGEACATSIILSVYLGYHVQPTYFTHPPQSNKLVYWTTKTEIVRLYLGFFPCIFLYLCSASIFFTFTVIFCMYSASASSNFSSLFSKFHRLFFDFMYLSSVICLYILYLMSLR